MVVQVSTRIDKTTKQQFDKVCESIGVSPSNALSILIKGVINYNGIPFDVAALPGKTLTKMSPMAMHEPAVAYWVKPVRPIKEPTPSQKDEKKPFGREYMKEKTGTADDYFNKVMMEEFKEYFEMMAEKPTEPSEEGKPKKAVRPPFDFGSMEGKVWMADDFDAPLDEFKEYM